MTTQVEATEVVYVIGSPHSRLVKIGRTIDVVKRLGDIQRMSPAPLEVLWTTPGGKHLEAALHRRFKTHRTHGEWFDFGELDAVSRIQQAVEAVALEVAAAAAKAAVEDAERQAQLAAEYEPAYMQSNDLGLPIYLDGGLYVLRNMRCVARLKSGRRCAGSLDADGQAGSPEEEAALEPLVKALDDADAALRGQIRFELKTERPGFRFRVGRLLISWERPGGS